MVLTPAAERPVWLVIRPTRLPLHRSNRSEKTRQIESASQLPNCPSRVILLDEAHLAEPFRQTLRAIANLQSHLTSNVCNVAQRAAIAALTLVDPERVAVEVGMILAALLFIRRVSHTTTISRVTPEYLREGGLHILLAGDAAALRVVQRFQFLGRGAVDAGG